jgi:hypothetical protein
LKPLPTGSTITSISGGTGTQSFKKIGISTDKNIFHVKDNGFAEKDMLRYDYPVDGRFDTGSIDQEVNFYFVSSVLDQHNFEVIHVLPEIQPTNIERTGFAYLAPIQPTTATTVGLLEPVVFSVTSGSLPLGLTLDTSTGVVSGTPKETIDPPGREVISLICLRISTALLVSLSPPVVQVAPPDLLWPRLEVVLVILLGPPHT